MQRKNCDKIIKKFFSNVLGSLRYELNKPGADKKAIEHNISCMLMLECNPAKFTRPEVMKANGLFITADGFSNELFGAVRQMIVAANIHYNAEPRGAFCAEKQISQLYRKSKFIMMKNDPEYVLKRVIFNNKLNRVY